MSIWGDAVMVGWPSTGEPVVRQGSSTFMYSGGIQPSLNLCDVCAPHGTLHHYSELSQVKRARGNERKREDKTVRERQKEKQIKTVREGQKDRKTERDHEKEKTKKKKKRETKRDVKTRERKTRQRGEREGEPRTGSAYLASISIRQ